MCVFCDSLPKKRKLHPGRVIQVRIMFCEFLESNEFSLNLFTHSRAQVIINKETHSGPSPAVRAQGGSCGFLLE